MNCAWMETRLIAYLDGRAEETERHEVEAHLGTCAVCRARAEGFRRVWDILDEVPMVEPSPAFESRLRERIGAETRPRVLGWLVPFPRLAFAVSLLIILSLWVSSLPPAVGNGPNASRGEEEFTMINDLRVLEDYDVVVNFEALSELPPTQPKQNREM